MFTLNYYFSHTTKLNTSYPEVKPSSFLSEAGKCSMILMQLSSQRSPVRSSVGSPVDMRKQLALCLTLIFLSIGLVACESTEEEVWEGEDAPPFCPSTWFDSGEIGLGMFNSQTLDMTMT